MVKYRVEIKKSAAKEIEHLPRKDIKVVLEKIYSLAENPGRITVKNYPAKKNTESAAATIEFFIRLKMLF